jgi:hypothetical protein
VPELCLVEEEEEEEAAAWMFVGVCGWKGTTVRVDLAEESPSEH